MKPLVFGLCNMSNSFRSFIKLTLDNDCSHIENVHLLFCAHLINIFSFLTGVEHRDGTESLTFNTIITKLIMHALHTSRYLQSK